MKILLKILLCMPLISLAATSYHGDSVMTPGAYSSAPMVQSGQSVSSGNQYTSTSVMEYQTASCPAGLTSNGSSTYNSAQRTITTTYLGSQMVGTTTSGWTDIDTDCKGIEYQTLTCPTGYIGSITQQREVATAIGGYQYGNWNTITNSCVPAIPPFQERYLVAESGYYYGRTYYVYTTADANVFSVLNSATGARTLVVGSGGMTVDPSDPISAYNIYNFGPYYMFFTMELYGGIWWTDQFVGITFTP